MARQELKRPFNELVSLVGQTYSPGDLAAKGKDRKEGAERCTHAWLNRNGQEVVVDNAGSSWDLSNVTVYEHLLADGNLYLASKNDALGTHGVNELRSANVDDKGHDCRAQQVNLRQIATAVGLEFTSDGGEALDNLQALETINSRHDVPFGMIELAYKALEKYDWISASNETGFYLVKREEFREAFVCIGYHKREPKFLLNGAWVERKLATVKSLLGIAEPVKSNRKKGKI